MMMLMYKELKICLAAEKFNINKIIFTSSVAVYGFAPNNTEKMERFATLMITGEQNFWPKKSLRSGY